MEPKDSTAMKERMKELVDTLREASKAYYQQSHEIMSNFEYDRLYDELLALEEKSGIVLAGSPTHMVGYELISELPKERHPSPMLSLDKTKDVAVLQSFLGEQKGILSWKMDGLTIVLHYEGGQLAKAVTRGNGETGEVITNNAKVFSNVPLSIPFDGELTLRGEAIITYTEFRRINAQIPDADARYKNPRNLCSGSVRQLNNQVTAERNVRFVAFTLVSAEGVDFENSHEKEFEWLESQGFEVVGRVMVTSDELPDAVERFAAAIPGNDYPSDGLVLTMDDIAYGASLGRTAKFPRNSMAFKWSDETAETVLREIEWSPSRTGLLNPVAIFDPVELEGTTVSRASVHNISVMEDLKLGIGDTITVYKANMIIPQIADDLTGSGIDPLPEHCPVCGGPTAVRQTNEAKVLVCANEACPAKKIGSFELFVSRGAMNIEGISSSGLEKFVAAGIIKEAADLFRLPEHRDEIVAMEGFGEKSYEKLVRAADRARHTVLPRLVYALGIPNVGESNAKVLCAYFKNDIGALRAAPEEELAGIEGIGPVIASSVRSFFNDPANAALTDELLDLLDIDTSMPDTEIAGAEDPLYGKTFVITGSLEHFANRKELQALIESRGGKVTGSVSAKTDYLINNDVNSASSKNRTARELGIPVIAEDDLLRLAGIEA